MFRKSKYVIIEFAKCMLMLTTSFFRLGVTQKALQFLFFCFLFLLLVSVFVRTAESLKQDFNISYRGSA